MTQSNGITGAIRPSEETSTFAQWRAAFRQLGKGDWGDISGYLFVLPAVTMFVLFNAWPIIRGLTIAFQDYRYLYEGWHPFNGIDNFVEMAGDETFWASLGRSAHFCALYIPAIILLPLGVATLLANIWNPLVLNVYRAITYLPVILPIAVAMLLWKHLFNPSFGYLNYAIEQVLGSGVAPRWTSNPKWIIPAIAISAIWKNAGYNTLLFLVGLYNINQELYEASALDGAGGLKQFFHITLPLLKPILLLTLVLSAGTIGITAESMIWFPTTSGPAGPQDAALTAGYYAYKIAFLYGDLRWGYAAAINLVLGIISMLVAAFVFRVLGERD